MARKQLVVAISTAVTVVLAGCSKSEDVPAGRRLFGDPPRIELVSVTPPAEQIKTVECDFTASIVGFLCQFGITNVQASAPIRVGGKYTAARFEVTVTDPQGVQDLLFVGASYVKPNTNEESTLVLFDDGAENKFPQSQADQISQIGQDCAATNCPCQQATHTVTSNDTTKLDGKFTRTMAFIPSSAPPILSDCIMVANEQVPISALISGGEVLSFRIDAVDRAGNLNTHDSQPTVTVLHYDPDDPAAFSCTGDPCGCCIYTWIPTGEHITKCGACEGLVSQDTGMGTCQANFTGGCCLTPEDCPE